MATTTAPRPLAVRAVGRAAHRWVAVWAVVLVVGVVWGTVAIADDPRQAVHAAPLFGRWAWRITPGVLLPAAIAVLVVGIAPDVARRLSMAGVAAATAATTTAWTVALSASNGWNAVAAPVATRHNYLPFATTIGDVGEFVRTFTERLGDYPVHVRGHPPGATLVFWALDRVGLHGSGPAAAVELVAWGVAAAAVVVTAAEVAGLAIARRAAPFVALAPAAVAAGTSADALFAAVIAVGVALVVHASGRNDGAGRAAALAGGAVLGGALHLTYGAVPLLLLPLAVVVARRRLDVLVPAAVGAAAVTGAFVAAGFWWFDGLAAVHEQYWDGIASRRSTAYFVVAGNPAALALACGPAFAVGLGHVRRPEVRRWLLPLAALAAVLVADLSALSKAEVERIWLPFFPWIVAAAGAIPAARQRPWLAVHAAQGVLLQVALRTGSG